MKKIWLSLMGGLLLLGNLTLASTPTTGEIKSMTTRLLNHKNNLITSLNNSHKKLKNIADDAKKFSDTSLFRAASCLKAIPESSQNLDFTKLTDQLKNSILNEYIKFDGDIKRYEFWLNTTDTVLFNNSIENFYNQNALKITALENEFYTNTTKTKEIYLEYLKNNKDLLVALAQKLDAIQLVDQTAQKTLKAYISFQSALKTKSALRENMENLNTQGINNLDNQLSQIINQLQNTHNPSAQVQAKYLVHKENFLKKFKSESNKALYAVFNTIFDYSKYLDIINKQQELHQKFDSSTGTINCNLLLTTTVNFTPYTNGIETESKNLISTFEKLTSMINDNKLDVKALESPASTLYNTTINKLNSELLTNFRLILEDETPKAQQQPAQTAELPQTTTDPSTQTPPQNPQSQSPAPTTSETPIIKTTFTQSFKKGQYSEQIKTLQTLLKTQGFYQGEINGVNTQATIQALYQFQLKNGIITGKEKNKAGYGRLGPKTRAALNALAS